MPLLCPRRRPSTQETEWHSPQKLSRRSENTETEYPKLWRLFLKASTTDDCEKQTHGCGNDDVDGTLHRVAFATVCLPCCASHPCPLDQPCLPCTGSQSHALDHRTTTTSCPYPRAQPLSPALISNLISATATVSAAIPFVL